MPTAPIGCSRRNRTIGASCFRFVAIEIHQPTRPGGVYTYQKGGCLAMITSCSRPLALAGFASEELDEGLPCEGADDGPDADLAGVLSR